MFVKVAKESVETVKEVMKEAVVVVIRKTDVRKE